MRDLAAVDISIVPVNDDRSRLVIDCLESRHANPPVVPSSAVQERHRVGATAALNRPALIGDSVIGADLAVRTPISINRVLVVSSPVVTMDADLVAVVVAPHGVFDRCTALAR